MKSPGGDIVRLSIGALLPAPTASLLIVASRTANFGLADLRSAASEFVFFAVSAFPFIALQSILYSFAMEFFANRRIKSHVLVILVGGLLGLAAALSLGVFPFFLLLGAAVGMVVAVVLRLLFVGRLTSRRSGPE